MVHHTVILIRKNWNVKEHNPLSYEVPSNKANKVTTEIMFKKNNYSGNQEK